MKCWQCLPSRKCRTQSYSGPDYFSPARIQTSLWLISLLNCIPSRNNSWQLQCLEITILLSPFCSWGVEAEIKAEFVTEANHQKSLFKGSELPWVIRGHSLQHRQIGQCHPGRKASNRSEIFWPFGLCHNYCVCKYKEPEVSMLTGGTNPYH